MISVSSDLISRQNRTFEPINIIDRLYLYQQWTGEIVDLYTNVVTNDTLVVNGNAGNIISNGDDIVVPLDDFDNIYRVYNVYVTNDKTYLFLLYGYSWPETTIGKTVCKRIDISERLLSNGISRIVQRLEGESLSDFDSGQMDFEVNNSDGYFRNKEKTGLFDSNYVFWAKYSISYKGLNESVNKFGGLLDTSRFVPDLYNKNIRFTVNGHSKELERYPAWNIADFDNPNLNIISGIDIISYTESDESEEGIKRLNYIPFSNTKMRGIEIISVSNTTTSGVKKLEFRYPHYFKWDNGDWVTVADISDTDDDSGEKILTAKDGSTASVKFGSKSDLSEYPDEDTEMWVNIKDTDDDANPKEVSDSGKPVLIFDYGTETTIRLHLQRVAKLASGSYSDITDRVNIANNLFNAIQVLEADNDSILLISPEQFWGVNFILNSAFSSADITFEYSTGGSTFSSGMTSGANGLVDNTNNLTESGRVTWNSMDGWAMNTLNDDSEESYKGYMIKVRRNSGSGTCKIFEIKNIIRAIGQTEDFLNVEFSQDRLSKEQLSDDIIIRYKNEEWQIGTWYPNISFNTLLDKALDEAHYNDDKRDLQELKFTFNTAKFNIWGKPPKYNYSKLPNSIAIDTDNNVIYIGIGNELWSATLSGSWIFLKEFNIDDSSRTYEIKHLYYYSGVIRVVLGTDLFNKRYGVSEVGNDSEYYKIIDYTISTGNTSSSSTLSSIYPCLRFRRNGWELNNGVLRLIGQEWTTGFLRHGGENICIPFRQLVTVSEKVLPTKATIKYNPRPDLYGGVGTEFIEWRFSSAVGYLNNDIYGKTYNSAMGYYGVEAVQYPGSLYAVQNLGFKYSFGNQGCILISSDGTIYMYKEVTDNDGNTMYAMVNLATGSHFPLRVYNETQLPSCMSEGDIPGNGYSGEVFTGFTRWNDVNTNNSVAYSYLTKFANIDWDKVWKYDAVKSIYTDNTNNANNGTDFEAFKTGNDILYLGSQKKFKLVNLRFSYNSSSNYVYEYWNGSAWTELEDTPSSSYYNGLESYFSFTLPTDWAMNSVNSSNQYWIRIRQDGMSSTTINANDCILKEQIIWESENETGYETCTPIWIKGDSTNNIIYGCAFDKDGNTDNGFKWLLFIFDLNNDTMYFTNEGDDYTFDGTYLYKNFELGGSDSVLCYAMAENIRYKDKPSYLIRISYDLSTHEITVNKLGTPITKDWGSQDMKVFNGDVYGITKDGYNFWEYSNSFYPRIEIATFTESDNIKNVLNSIAKINNCYYAIMVNRYMKFYRRGNSSNEILSLVWDKNMVRSNPNFLNWKHYYDSAIIGYNNVITNENGTKKDGFTGWLKKSLSIRDNLIQNSHLAKSVSEKVNEYFNAFRLNPENIKTIYLSQLEIFDEVTIDMPESLVDVDSDLTFLIIEIESTPDRNMYLKLLELETGDD